MSDDRRQGDDRQSIAIVVAILAGVLALGLVAAGIGAWALFGQARARQAELDAMHAAEAAERAAMGAVADGRDVVLVLVDGLRADAFDDATKAHPLVSALVAKGAELDTFHTRSTGTTAAVASFLVAPDWWERDLGLISPKDVGFHRLPEEVPVRAEAWRDAGGDAYAFCSSAALDGERTGLERGFVTWFEPERDRDFRAVLEEAELQTGARARVAPLLTLLQLDLGDEPDPARLVPLLHARLDRFGDERAGVEAALDEAFETDAERVRAVEKLVGRKRGTAAWSAWRRSRYDALVLELEQALLAFLESRDDPDVLVAGTRGRLVDEPRPEPEREGFSDALVRVPLLVLDRSSDRALAPVLAEPSVVVSPARGSFRTTDQLDQDRRFFVHAYLRSETVGEAAMRVVGESRSRLVLGALGDGWRAGTLSPAEPHAAIRVDLGGWAHALADHLRVVAPVENLANFQLGDRGTATSRRLRDTAWCWVADPNAPAWDEGSLPLVDVTRDRTRWRVALDEGSPRALVVHLCAYPLEPDADPLEPLGGEVLSGPLPGAAVCRVMPGDAVTVTLPPGKRVALRVSDAEGAASNPSVVRYEGRRLFGDEASFLVPGWWLADPAWFVPGPVQVEEAPLRGMDDALLIQFTGLRVDRRVPTIRGPLGLTPDDVAALRRLPDDA